MTSSHHLFVYGTLAPGEINADQLAPLGGSWQVAKVRGTLHAEGWGASYGFPAMRLDEHSDFVVGQLFTSPDLPEHWSRLDEFEGDAYRRVITDVQLENGTKIAAHIYVLNE